MKVNKEAVDKIEEEINRIDIKKINLDAEALEYLETLGLYIDCFDCLQVRYEKIDPNRLLAEYDMPDIKEPIQQVSKTGEPVKNIDELYEAAESMLPVFEAKINGLVEQLDSSGGVKFKLPPGENKLKGRARASEKAQDDYAKIEPGPAVSWLNDIVRGSLLFDTIKLLFKFLELLRAEKSIVIVKSKNRFRNPTLSGYRDFNMQIQITNNEDGSKHICELQLHIKDIKELAISLNSHSYYEFFRKYFAGATASLEERMNDFREICKGGSLDMAFLANVVENPLEVDRMTRLADLFKDCMNEYQLAIVITNAAKEVMEPQEWYTRLGSLFHLQGELIDALDLYKMALDIQVETLGPDHTLVAQSYISMANVLTDQGRYDEAMDFYGKVLDIPVEALGPDHAPVAHACSSIGKTLTHQGSLEEAMDFAKKELDIRVKALGPEHTDIADFYIGMADAYYNNGSKEDQKEEAIELYKKALDIRLKALGPEHTDVATCYYRMLFVLWNQGKLGEAMSCAQKAREIYMKLLGPRIIQIQKLVTAGLQTS